MKGGSYRLTYSIIIWSYNNVANNTSIVNWQSFRLIKH